MHTTGCGHTVGLRGILVTVTGSGVGHRERGSVTGSEIGHREHPRPVTKVLETLQYRGFH